jgi:hypothetical protein
MYYGSGLNICFSKPCILCDYIVSVVLFCLFVCEYIIYLYSSVVFLSLFLTIHQFYVANIV